MSGNRYHKNEKLKSRKQIGELFLSGKQVSVYPVKALWNAVSDETAHVPPKAGFTVPKRNFRHAVDRNLLKRRMRESYRCNKSDLAALNPTHRHNLQIMFIYTSSKKEAYPAIESAIKKILAKISRQVTK